jgi:hypothetical protein
MNNTIKNEYLQELKIGLKLACKALTRIMLYDIIVLVKRTIFEGARQ